MPVDDIEVEVSSTRCLPLTQQLLRLSPTELQAQADALGVRGPTLSRPQFAHAVAAAILVARK